jgi:hypothetical protein
LKWAKRKVKERESAGGGRSFLADPDTEFDREEISAGREERDRSHRLEWPGNLGGGRRMKEGG